MIGAHSKFKVTKPSNNHVNVNVNVVPSTNLERRKKSHSEYSPNNTDFQRGEENLNTESILDIVAHDCVAPQMTLKKKSYIADPSSVGLSILLMRGPSP